MSAPVLGEAQLDALREIGNIGAGTAATALAQMTGRSVPMGVPTVTLLPVEQVADRTGDAERVVAAMFLGVGGDVSGHMLFVMGRDAARDVVDALMGGAGGAGGGDGFSEMELSALQEVANILTGSYLNALAKITGLRLEPTPPAVGVDFAGALVGAALAEVAMASETAILIETPLGDGGAPSLGDVLFIPTSAALQLVLARLGLG
ncbi:MAG: chemotaxis protein CheC [Thermoleophilia bacterium]